MRKIFYLDTSETQPSCMNVFALDSELNSKYLAIILFLSMYIADGLRQPESVIIPYTVLRTKI